MSATPEGRRKEELREHMRARRRLVPAAERERASRAIARRVLERVDWDAVATLHVYRAVAAWGEIDTEPITAALAGRVPAIEIHSAGASAREPLPAPRFDLVIVPVLAFDRGNFRLGLGAGFYDRLLAAQPQARAIGLAYRWARLERLPREPHDVPLARIVTDADDHAVDVLDRDAAGA